MSESTTLDVGMTQEALADKVIRRAANRLARSLMTSDRLMEPLRSVLTKTIDEETHRIANEEIRPWATGQIESVVMQRTNEWGERRGEPMSFRQYLVERAEAYLSEKVNYQGKAQNRRRRAVLAGMTSVQPQRAPRGWWTSISTTRLRRP